METFSIQLKSVLTASPPSELEFIYTGSGHGTAGPGEIDETQTFDSFARISDFE